MSTLIRILKMPWLATIRSAQRWLYIFVWFVLFSNTAKAMPLAGAWAQVGVTVLAMLLAIIWTMVADSIWLARDADRLRLPGIGRDTDYVLALFAGLSVVLPALILGALFGHVVVWLVSLGLLGAGVLAFFLLPTALSLAVLVAVLVATLLFGWRPPLPGDPGFLAWGVPALAVLVAAAVQRWITLRRAGVRNPGRWLRPASAASRQVAVRRLYGGDPPVALLAGTPGARRMGCARLERVGPGHPGRSIRAALGRHLKPMDLGINRTRRRRLVALVVLMVLILPAIAWLVRSTSGIDLVLRQSNVLLLWMAVLSAFVHTNRSNGYSISNWNARHTGLAMLALLPRLDHPARLKRDAVLALAARQLMTKAAFVLSSALVLAVLRLPAMFYAYLALMWLCGAAGELAIASNTVGGVPLAKSTLRLLCWSTVVPIVVTMAVAVQVVAGPPIHLEMLGWHAAVGITLWLAWTAGFAALGARGWLALKARPHPFLANPG